MRRAWALRSGSSAVGARGVLVQGQMGALTAAETAAFLLIGLPAGAWVDRMRKRRTLIVADLVRAAARAVVVVAGLTAHSFRHTTGDTVGGRTHRPEGAAPDQAFGRDPVGDAS